MQQPSPRVPKKEVTMKARYYRVMGSVSVVSVLVAVLGAPKKWG
jgi:hypothetical protein